MEPDKATKDLAADMLTDALGLIPILRSEQFWRFAYAGLAMNKLRSGDYNTLADMCDDAFNEADAMLAEAEKRETDDGPGTGESQPS